MCSDLGGFFLKVAQIIGKPDLAPAAWVRRLVTLCDQSPATPYDVIRVVLEKELSQSVDGLFERFEVNPLGSASILMMTDIRNLQAFALYMQKTDIKFDLFSITKEMEKQLAYLFYLWDCLDIAEGGDGDALELDGGSGWSSLAAGMVAGVIMFVAGLIGAKSVNVSRGSSLRVLVMEYIDGIPILKLGDEIAKSGINPGGKIAAAAKRSVREVFKHVNGLILQDFFFECKYCLDLPDNLRLGNANLVIAIADKDPPVLLAFHQKHIKAFPEELFSVLRMVHLLRGLSVGLGINYSCAEQWRPIAEETLYLAGRLKAYYCSSDMLPMDTYYHDQLP
ncbi:hypothetical protein LOK49_Contig152G00005 [Camellia lanceoleosa]|nr:hypothetical protein LOK49_Contig152G00005 [Camellia lanceoleosa]